MQKVYKDPKIDKVKYLQDMNFKWISLLIILHLMVSGTAERKCPEECTCMEDHDRFVTLCYQGG